MLKLYSYWRSSASYRTRIALHYKQIPYEYLPVHLLRDGGEQHKPEYRQLNPQGYVPCLVDGDRVLTQSLAIIEYLDERYPARPLLPAEPFEKAQVRALAYMLACDTHPLNNLKVLKYLSGEMAISDENKNRWIQHWIDEGLRPLEAALAKRPSSRFSFGETPNLLDVSIPPLIYSAERFDCDLSPFPTVMRIHDNAMALPEFQSAHPQVQPDAA